MACFMLVCLSTLDPTNVTPGTSGVLAADQLITRSLIDCFFRQAWKRGYKVRRAVFKESFLVA
jgi:hypothetical protein